MAKIFRYSPKLRTLCLLWLLLTLNCSPSKEVELVRNGIGESEVSLILAASEMVVGKNRFPFGVLSTDGELLKGSPVRVEFFRLGSELNDEPRFKAEAIFREVKGSVPHSHIDGRIHIHEEATGVHVVEEVEFSNPGIWVAKIYPGESLDTVFASKELHFQVLEESATFMVGDFVPNSRNPVSSTLENLDDITTHYPPIPELYQLTVAQALKEKKPLVVVFSTPAFCVSRMCGPVTDVIAGVFNKYKGTANFIHIEPWELESARRDGSLVWSEVASEWRLPSEPWVFIIDMEGKVFARFEGVVSGYELEKALENLLT